MDVRQNILFFAILFGFGLLFHALGIFAGVSSTSPMTLFHVCLLSVVLGGFSRYVMGDEGTKKTGALHVAGVPLFFILGLNGMQPWNLVLVGYLCYGSGYLIGSLVLIFEDALEFRNFKV